MKGKQEWWGRKWIEKKRKAGNNLLKNQEGLVSGERKRK